MEIFISIMMNSFFLDIWDFKIKFWRICKRIIRKWRVRIESIYETVKVIIE